MRSTNSAPRLQRLAPGGAVAELLADDPVLDGPEHSFLLDEAARAGNVARSQDAAGEPAGCRARCRSSSSASFSAARKSTLSLILALMRSDEAQMDDVAGMFEIADVEHDLERPAAVLRRGLVLGELGDIGLDVALVRS